MVLVMHHNGCQRADGSSNIILHALGGTCCDKLSRRKDCNTQHTTVVYRTIAGMPAMKPSNCMHNLLNMLYGCMQKAVFEHDDMPARESALRNSALKKCQLSSQTVVNALAVLLWVIAEPAGCHARCGT